MSGPLPWIIGLGATALVALAKSKQAKAEPVEPVEPVAPVQPPRNTVPQPSAPVTIMPVPRTALPPIIPPDAVEIEDPGLEDITDTSPGQPIQPLPKKKPKTVGEVLQPIEDVLDELPIDPGEVETPISIDQPIDQPIDLGELEEIIVDIPDDNEEGLEVLEPSDLALEVYNITQGGPRNLKGSEVRTIRAYQSEEELKTDGLYGPNTAETLIKYGFVPETPWIWPREGASAAKRDWRSLTQEMAQKDPQRADEWAASGNV